ncbi:hypothetical protein [Brevibacterium picturae]|uniref:Uncharacterized protein n=1 Tax=Brevibacterium picturae TaxID=260553 RepID=A0ABN2CL96_9MICO
MIPHTTTAAAGGEDYTTGEGLRALLGRLHEEGPGAWRTDPTAARLMTYAADKYAALARKHGLDPWEAASAAFDVMRTRSAREAEDPWAVVTHAVRITCIAEKRGQGLLCSTHQARRPHYSVFHDAERLSDRENPLDDYHPAFHITDPDPDEDADPGDANPDEGRRPAGPAGVVTSAAGAVEDAIAFITVLGWPPQTARAAVEHVCQALARAGSRQSAFEVLRRDQHSRALLDLPGTSWTALLRVLLGNPAPGLSATNAGRGILLRLLIGETLPVLLHDDDLVLTVSLAAPKHGGGR